MLISYNWLKSYLPELPDAKKVSDILTYHLTEVEGVETLQNGDSVFDVNILPNRAHDLLSHQGMAHELAGLLSINFNSAEKYYKIPDSVDTNLEIKIDTDKCNRYMGRIVRGVKVGPSPAWVVEHLASIGQRSVNNIVDATNIVMYDCGNPTHAFDLAQISSGKIVVRNAKEDEELSLVGRESRTVKLKNSDMVITDGVKTLAIAGVKGGFDSGVSDITCDILIEVANFDATCVRKTARRIGELTDSAKRFENDLSPSLCEFAMKELSALIAEMCPDAVFEDVVDVYPNTEVQKTLKFFTSDISRFLGVEVSSNDIEKFMHSYEFAYANDFEKGEWTLQVPLLRRDLENTQDIVEEIGRWMGYDRVSPVLPQISFVPKENTTYKNIKNARNILLSNGYKEVMTYAFADKGDIEVLASASDKNFLRKNLIDGIKKSFELNKLNAPFVGLKEVKIFEIGTVFLKDKEEIHVCFANKKEVKEMSLDEFIASSEVLSERSSDLLANTKNTLGQTVSESTSDFAHVNFKMWSLFPFMTRDISVWVPENTDSSVLCDIYKEFGTELLVREPDLIDKFTKEGRTSYAYRLVFQSYEKTLTDEEVNVIMMNITSKISDLGYQVR